VGRWVRYGAALIKERAESPEEKLLVAEEHWGLIRELAETVEMKKLADLWREIEDLAERAKDIADRAQRSYGILYPVPCAAISGLTSSPS